MQQVQEADKPVQNRKSGGSVGSHGTSGFADIGRLLAHWKTGKQTKKLFLRDDNLRKKLYSSWLM